MLEAQAGGEAVRRNRTGDDAGAEPALARGRDDPRAGVMHAVRSPTAEHGTGERAAANRRSAERQPVGEGRLESDSPTPRPRAPVGLGAHQTGHRRAGIEPRELGARRVDDRLRAEVRPNVAAHGPGCPEVGLQAQLHGAPRARGVARGDDVRQERACGHERAELSGIEHEGEPPAHLAGRQQLAVGVESGARGGEPEIPHLHRAPGLRGEASGGVDRRHRGAARREAEVPDREVRAARTDGRRGRELDRRRGEAAGRRGVELRDRHPPVAHLESPHLERHPGRAAASGELRQAPGAVLPHEPHPRRNQREAADEEAAAKQREWRVDDLDSRHARDAVARDRHPQVAEHE